jgi:hypothetical protein
MSGEGSDRIVFLREGVIQSWLRDGFTLAMLAFLPWFNHVYCGGSGWINMTIAFMWFVSITARASDLRRKSEKTPAELRAWLDEHYPADGAA